MIRLPELMKTVLVATGGIWLQVYAAQVDVETCSDWETAVEATLAEDTTANLLNRVDSFFGQNCGNGTFKSFEVKNNKLTVVAPTIFDSDGPRFWDIRFEVTDGGAMNFTTSVDFRFTTRDENDLEVNGGFFHVGEGSAARFMKNLDVWDYGTTSVTESGFDFTSDVWDGGCLWNNGSFIVAGVATFDGCFNIGGGESSPGRGGAIFNDVNAYIAFDGGVNIKDTYLTDNSGNSGAGVHNLGEIDVKGDSIFQDLTASDGEGSESGGGIFNGEGATFQFKNEAVAAFVDTAAYYGGGVYNAGNFSFSGPAIFIKSSSGSAIYNASPGNMKLSEGSVFFANVGTYGGAVWNEYGAELYIADDISFLSNFAWSLCDDIYLEKDDSDSVGYTCYP